MNGLKNNLTKPLMYYFVYKITNCINNTKNERNAFKKWHF